ncbi:hypothetical protein [Caldibacillus phage CBP1]|uniref:Uncharacterized protein n=1 Tax=Caldibacillus debilis GB1 TaxID=1339248 RepID=A0A420VJM3_9BACI|nr:hypothetical protein [Caldibacillus debilis]ATB52716.1 hypothetical protein [Caldibacillus phage CBP1]RKO63543.1 hypothetical protein Cdeb_02806 [Caldibacillus debilis GB1]
MRKFKARIYANASVELIAIIKESNGYIELDEVLEVIDIDDIDDIKIINEIE